MINAGVYILEKDVLNSIPADTNYSFERQLFPDLCSAVKQFMLSLPVLIGSISENLILTCRLTRTCCAVRAGVTPS